MTAPLSDSKGAAIDKILVKHARWATDLIDQPVHQYPDATLDPAQAKQALYDRLAEEAVEIEQYVTGPLMKQPKIFKALPLSKLKELMGAAE